MTAKRTTTHRIGFYGTLVVVGALALASGVFVVLGVAELIDRLLGGAC